MKFKTKLWKRSEKSFASTIPHIALLTMNEDEDHEVVWEYNSEINKWTFELVSKKNKSSTKNNISTKKNKPNSEDEKVKSKGGDKK